uniref:Serine/threonine protein kinase n=1 Tax=Clandestinovirus TaxID=2831644 RepID=A0A8F8KNY5_9VIRU|nr:serine/threonine protein kinase [Clandestinovirus]
MIELRRVVSTNTDGTTHTPTRPIHHKRLPFSVALDDSNRYNVILKAIGTGGSSHVFKALDTKLNRFVALKIVDARQMSKGDYAHVKNETQILKLLEHPNVIQMLDCFELMELPEQLSRVIQLTPKDIVVNHPLNIKNSSIPDLQRKPFSVIVYPLCSKGDLFEYIADKYDADTARALSEEEAKKIFQSICLGIEHCHSRHIAHRDIKPENVLLDLDGVPKLADFGFALKLPFAEFKASDPVGTVRTVAPEVLTGEKYDAIKSDIWSLGLMLYFMLLGTFPYPYDDEDCVRMIDFYDALWEQTDKIPLDGEDGEFSAELHNLLPQLLTFDPTERPSIQQILAHPWFQQK